MTTGLVPIDCNRPVHTLSALVHWACLVVVEVMYGVVHEQWVAIAFVFVGVLGIIVFHALCSWDLQSMGEFRWTHCCSCDSHCCTQWRYLCSFYGELIGFTSTYVGLLIMVFSQRRL